MMMMSNLVSIITNKEDREIKNPVYAKKKRIGGPKRVVRIAHFMGGYWFVLTRNMWSKHCGVSYGTLCGRHKAGQSTDVIFGYEKLIKKKPPGRPRRNG